MSARLLLVGPLADPAMMAALGLEPAGAAVTLPGRLSGGGRAGIAPRPARSVLDTSKIEATGFTPVDASEALRDHLSR